MSVKLKTLKTLTPAPHAGAGPNYQPIPHYDLLKVLRTALLKSGDGSPHEFHTDLEQNGAVMTSTVRPVPKQGTGRIVPCVFLASTYLGRQPAEAAFGFQITSNRFSEVKFSFVCSKTTVVRRHTLHADLEEWAGRVALTFNLADRDAMFRIGQWWKSRRAATAADGEFEEYMGEWAGRPPTRPSKTMVPLLKRSPSRVRERMEADAHGLGQTEAGLLAAVCGEIENTDSPLLAWSRRFGLFLRMGSIAPPDAFTPPKTRRTAA